jgi:hypothetical protein
MEMRRRGFRPIWLETGRPLSIGRTVALYAAAYVVMAPFLAIVVLGAHCVNLGGRAAWIGWGLILWSMLWCVPNAVLARKRLGRRWVRRRVPARGTPPRAGLWDRELDAIPMPAAQYGRGSARMRG